jgi:membrane protease YdiL (CAAX protease family)
MMMLAIGYLAAIALAETVTVFVQPLWGVVLHIVTLVVLVAHSALAARSPHQKLLISLALVPLVRIISLSMPLANIPQVWRFPIIYAPLLAAGIVVMRILEYRPTQVGISFSRLPVQVGLGLTGVLFGVAEYYILRPDALITELTWQQVWLPAIIFLLCTGFVEEFIFRGVLQTSALGSLGRWAIPYVSLVFAILHLGFLSWIDVAFVFLIAMFFGWIVKRTGSIVGVALSHGLTNVLLYLIVPLVLT